MADLTFGDYVSFDNCIGRIKYIGEKYFVIEVFHPTRQNYDYCYWAKVDVVKLPDKETLMYKIKHG